MYFNREQNLNKEVKKTKIEKKAPHTISNRALSDVVNTLNSTEITSVGQEETEDHSDESERYTIHLNKLNFILLFYQSLNNL